LKRQLRKKIELKIARGRGRGKRKRKKKSSHWQTARVTRALRPFAPFTLATIQFSFD